MTSALAGITRNKKQTIITNKLIPNKHILFFITASILISKSCFSKKHPLCYLDNFCGSFSRLIRR